jgi:type II secretory pathway component PulC
VAKFTFFFFLLVSVGVQASALNDPTKPINYKTGSAVIKSSSRSILPTLQSILGSDGNRKAIINNQLYTIGKQVDGYRITKITTDTVLLTYQGKAYTLTLYPNKKSFIE